MCCRCPTARSCSATTAAIARFVSATVGSCGSLRSLGEGDHFSFFAWRSGVFHLPGVAAGAALVVHVGVVSPRHILVTHQLGLVAPGTLRTIGHRKMLTQGGEASPKKDGTSEIEGRSSNGSSRGSFRIQASHSPLTPCSSGSACRWRLRNGYFNGSLRPGSSRKCRPETGSGLAGLGTRLVLRMQTPEADLRESLSLAIDAEALEPGRVPLWMDKNDCDRNRVVLSQPG